ncbi:FecR domain-containing protein [Sphingomonas sp. KR3-1]|uniref:FecR family protein n=1 Tax=Sphingomonas sp. KR3-1 TaxID=3156611 RepID=UPI0032B56EA4
MRLESLDHLNRLQSGDATDRDAAALIAWRSQSRAHEEAFRAALRLRMLVRTVEGGAGVRPDETVPDAQPEAEILTFVPRAARQLTRRRMIGGAIAASVAGGGIVVGRTFELIPSPSEALADYRTGPGERRVVRLAGGASVDLNTRTAIDLRADLRMPAIELVSGEAVLSSGGNGRAALVAGAGTSVVQNGRFNARRDGDAVCITCLAGEVVVRWTEEMRTLGPADEVRYAASGIGAVVRGADTAALTAWQSGTLIFRAMPLRQVVTEINRYRSGRVFLANSALGARPLSGTYYVNRLDDFFSQAELALGINVARYPGNIVVLS